MDDGWILPWKSRISMEVEKFCVVFIANGQDIGSCKRKTVKKFHIFMLEAKVQSIIQSSVILSSKNIYSYYYLKVIPPQITKFSQAIFQGCRFSVVQFVKLQNEINISLDKGLVLPFYVANIYQISNTIQENLIIILLLYMLFVLSVY